jgi:hypothetical protein
MPCSAGPSHCDLDRCPPSATLASPAYPPGQDKAARCCCRYTYRTPRRSCRPSQVGQSCTATPTPCHSQTCHVCCKRASGTQTKAFHIPWPSRPLGAANSSTRMCLSLDSPALLLVLLHDLLLMRHFLHLPGWQWKSSHPCCRQDGASRQNRSYRRKCYPPHVRCG